jgi:phospholipid/cholesterol/gamma-HCH transport system substrate-binding protein
MDLHHKREVTVGAMVIIAVVLFVVTTSWLSGRSLTPGQRVTIEFSDAAGLKRGSPVRVSGMQVGRVEQIALVRYGTVRLTVSLDRGIEPRSDATAGVVAVGLAGDVAVELVPGTAPDRLPAGQSIPGTIAPGFMQLGEVLADKAEVALDNFNAMLDPALVRDMQATLRSLQEALAAFGDARTGPAAELSQTLASLRALTGRVDSALASDGTRRALANLDTLSGRMVEMTSQFTATGAQLDSLLGRINRGEGTLGRAMTDDGLYDEIRSATRAFQKLLEEISKNPGKITIQVRVF